MAFGQIGIGTSTPDSDCSILDVYSTDKGMLFPRMNSTQRDDIVNPAKGLIIYNLDAHCLQVNQGTNLSPDWHCIGDGFQNGPVVYVDCDTTGFYGGYYKDIPLDASNKFSVTIKNNSFSSVDLTFTTNDLELSGILASDITVNSVNPTSATIPSGGTQVIEYTLTGTPQSIGGLYGNWTKGVLQCFKSTVVSQGDATFTLPQTLIVVSLSDGTPVTDIQGVIDNGSNQLSITLPYTEGGGTYEAYTGTFTPNNAGTGESDANSFRLTYPAGTFSASGSITATIEVDGDGSFNAKKQLFNIQETIASLDFQVNGNSKGYVNIDVTGGVPDRNFNNPDYKFIYLPVVAADGNTWLNNNLGAGYSNMNYPQFDPTQQATSYDDYHAYGSLFQWGRYSDGHELVTYTSSTTGAGVNGTTSPSVATDTPGHNLFILETISPNDWRSPQNNNLWQGESGINNPCPVGYRVPTEPELNALLSAEGISSATANYLDIAANSSLAFTAAGSRGGITDGSLANQGVVVLNWSSTVDGTHASSIYVHSGLASTLSVNRASGTPVRCIKD